MQGKAPPLNLFLLELGYAQKDPHSATSLARRWRVGGGELRPQSRAAEAANCCRPGVGSGAEPLSEAEP